MSSPKWTVNDRVEYYKQQRDRIEGQLHSMRKAYSHLPGAEAEVLIHHEARPLRKELKDVNGQLKRLKHHRIQRLLPFVSVVAVLAVIAMFQPEFLGMVIGPGPTVVPLDIEADSNIVVTLPLDEIPTSVMLTGEIRGEGTAKVYVVSDGVPYLAVDRDALVTEGRARRIRFRNECVDSCEITTQNDTIELLIEADGTTIRLQTLSYVAYEEPEPEVEEINETENETVTEEPEVPEPIEPEINDTEPEENVTEEVPEVNETPEDVTVINDTEPENVSDVFEQNDTIDIIEETPENETEPEVPEPVENVTVNRPPSLTRELPVLMMEPNSITTFDLKNYVEDADLDPVFYSPVPTPYLLASVTNGVLMVESYNNATGNLTLQITVTDGKDELELELVVSILVPENNPPEAIKALPELFMEPNMLITLELDDYFIDPEGEELIYTIEHPDGLTVTVDVGPLFITADENITNTTLDLTISDGVNEIQSQIFIYALESEPENLTLENITIPVVPNITLSNVTNFTWGVNMTRMKGLFKQKIKNKDHFIEKFTRENGRFNAEIQIERAKLMLEGLKNVTNISDIEILEPDSEVRTDIVKIDRIDIDKATIWLQKYSKVEFIVRCDQFLDGNCMDWVRTPIPFVDNTTHIIFAVDHFTAYAGGGGNNSNLTLWDDNDAEGGSQGKTTGETITFYANYTNHTSGASINGTNVYCEITFSTAPAGPYNMTFNSSTLIYEYNRTFNTENTYNWNVTCNGSATNYNILNTTDTITVTQTPPTVTLILPQNDTTDTDGTITFESNITSTLEVANATLYTNESEWSAKETRWNGEIDYNMSNLLLLWHLNNETSFGENETSVYDFSGNGNNGSCLTNRCGLENATGVFGKSRWFDGDDWDGADYLTTPTDLQRPYEGPYSISLWFNRERNSLNDSERWYLLNWYPNSSATGNLVYLEVDANSNITGYFRDGGVDSVSVSNAMASSPIGFNQWYHVFYSKINRTTVRLYLDGEFMDEATNSNLDSIWGNTANAMQVGIWKDASASTWHFWNKGRIDEFAIWNRSFTAQEVAAIYNYSRTKFYPVFQNETLANGDYIWNVLAYDNESNSGWAEDNFTLTVSNAIPNVSAVILNDGAGNVINTTNITLTFTSNDDNEDAVYNVTDWRENGTSIAVVNLPFNTNVSTVGTGDVLDYSSYRNNGTLGGGDSGKAPVWNSSGQIGGAYSFDGSADFIQITNDASLNITQEITFSAWIMKDAVKLQTLLAKSSAYRFRIQAGNQFSGYMFTSGTTGDKGTTVSVPLSSWTHVAGTYDQTNGLLLYVNGNEATGAAGNSGSGTIDLTAEDVYIGSLSGTGRHFTGNMDEVLLLDRALGADEIKAIYDAGLAKRENYLMVQNETEVDDKWSVCVTPSDAEDDGTTACSANITVILNTASYSSFSAPPTTDINAEGNISNVCQARLQKNTMGQIRWAGCFNATGADFDSYAFISAGLVGIDSSNMDSTFNSSANITMYDLNFTATPLIFKDDVLCSDSICTTLNYYANGTFIFNVTEFSNYTVGSNSNLTIWDDNDPEGGSQGLKTGQQIFFYANFTNLTSGASINGTNVYCEITFNTAPTGPYNMTFNSTTLIYEYNRTFNTANTYNWNVTCNGSATNYDILNLSDTITVAQSPPTVTLVLPENDSTDADGIITFESNATSTIEIANATLYTNESGWSAKETRWNGEVPYNSSGLVALYHLNNESAFGENSTYVIDWSGNGNNGTTAGGVLPNVTGKFGKAFEFDMIDDLIEIPADNSINAYGKSALTVAAWVYPRSDGEGDFAKVLDKADSTADASGDGYSMKVRDEAGGLVRFSFKFQHDGTDALFNTDLVYSINEWHHVVAIYNASGFNDIHMYVDGQNCSSYQSQINGTGAVSDDTDLNLTIGNYDGASSRTWDGYIDEVAIWNRNLSGTEIEALYNYTKTNFQPVFQDETLVDGDYIWNVLAYDNESNSTWASNNFTINVDWTDPFNRCMNITIINVGTTILTDFPAYINLTYDSDMRSDYSDIRFSNTSCYNGGSELDYEIENYTGTNAHVWVKIPSLTTPNETISVYYNASGVGDGQNQTGVWSDGFNGVYHLSETGSSEIREDSTINDNNLTPTNYEGDEAVTGIVAGGDDFDGDNDYLVSISATGMSSVNGTIEMWLETPANAVRYAPFYLYESHWSDHLNIRREGGGSPEIEIAVEDGDVHILDVDGDNLADNNTHYIVFTQNGTEMVIYIDGELSSITGQNNDSWTSHLTLTALWLGRDVWSYYLDASMDEVRIANKTRSQDWANQTYQIIVNQGTYVIFGSEEGNPPRTVSLISPVDEANVISPVSFISNVTAINEVGNATLYTNVSGSWTAQETRWNGELDWNIDGLVGLWHFNKESSFGENDTQVHDFSGNGITGTAVGTPVYNLTGGRLGPAYTYTGSEYFNFGDNLDMPEHTGMTIMAWINANSFSVWATGIIEKYGHQGNYYLITKDDGRITFRLMNQTNDGGVAAAETNGGLDTGKWYHVAASYDDVSTAKIYVNGQLNDSDSAVYVPGGRGDTPARVLRVGYNFNNNAYFDGTIDEVAIFNRALSDAEVESIYNYSRTKFYPVFQTVTADMGTYIWNVKVNDNETNISWADSNFTFYVGYIATNVTLITPPNGTVTVATLINFTLESTGSDKPVNATLYTDEDSSWLARETRWFGETDWNQSGLVALYHFNNESSFGENESLVYDFSDNRNNGTIMGDSRHESGRYSNAISFDGDYDFVNISNPSGITTTGHTSITGWFKLDQAHNSTVVESKPIFVYYNNSNSMFYAVLEGTEGSSSADPGSLTFKVEDADNGNGNMYIWSQRTSWEPDTWYHFALLAEFGYSDDNKIFINGIDDTNSTTSGWGDSVMQYDGQLTIGGGYIEQSSANRYFNGSIDEFAIWHKKLTANEITTLYDSGSTYYNPQFQPREFSTGTYLWNALVEDNQTNISWASDNFTLTVAGAAIYSNYDVPPTTDFNNEGDITNSCQPVLQINDTARIQWTSCVNASGADFDSNVSLGVGYAYVNASGLNEIFNSSANITLFNLSFTQRPTILMDGVTCPRSVCQVLNWSAGTLIFNVTHFSNYSATAIVTLIDPANNSNVSRIVSFTSNVTDINTITNATLYTNTSGSWQAEETRWNGEIAYNDSGLVLLLHFNNETVVSENDTLFYDWSGNNLNGTCTTCGIYNETGKFGYGYTCTGNDEVTVADDPLLGGMDSITIQMWVILDELSSETGNNIQFDQKWNQTAPWASWYSWQNNANDRLSVIFSNSSASTQGATGTTSLVKDTWYHIVWRYNGTEVDIFLDGDLETAGSDPLTGPVLDSNLQLDICDNGASGRLNGTIDEYAIWNRSLSDTEIEALYNYTKTRFYPVFQPITAIENTYVWNVKMNDNESNISWANGNFTFSVESPNFHRCMNITITNVGTTTLTNFPAYINLTYDSDMRSDYSDVRFYNTSCDNSDGSNLDHEIENYTGTNAHIWVKILSLTTPNETISVRYNASNISDGQDPTGVWSDGFNAVYHLSETGTTATRNDSTYNNNDLTPQNYDGDEDVEGVVDGADDFNGSSNYLSGSASANTASSLGTIEMWVETHDDADRGAKFYLREGAGWNDYIHVERYSSGTFSIRVADDSDMILQVNNGTWLDNKTHYIVYTQNGTEMTMFIDGNRSSMTGTNNDSWTGHLTPNLIWLGNSNWGYEHNGLMDEVRLANKTRTGDWINQTYQIIENQGTIVSFGSEEGATTPNDPTPLINSTDGTNLTTQDLNCNATITDPNSGDTLNVSVRWYLNGSLNLTFDYNNNYASETLFNATLNSSNTTIGDNWSCSIRLNDSQEVSSWGNSENITVNLNPVNYSNFDTPPTTNYQTEEDIANVCQARLQKNTIGQIRWTGCVDATNADFDSYAFISAGLTGIDSSNMDSSFNSSANITMYNLNYSAAPLIYKDGTECSGSICTVLNYYPANGTFIFNVTEFSNYTVGSNSNLTIWDDNDPEGGSQGKVTDEQISFYANFTNLTSGASINGTNVYCEIMFNTAPAGPENMTFNSSTLIYEYNRTFNTANTYNWNVTCNGSATNYDILNLSDTITVAQSPPTVTLILPQNDTTDTDGTITFESNATSTIEVANATLYTNESSWSAKETRWNGEVPYNHSSLLVLYHFNNESAFGENITYINDWTGNGYYGNCSGSICPTYNESGYFGSAYFYDGDDYFNITNYGEYGYTNFTIALWYKSNATSESNDQYFWVHRTDGYVNYSAFAADASGDLRYVSQIDSGGFDNIVIAEDVTDQLWHHVVVVRNSTNITFYADGSLSAVRADGYAGQTIYCDATRPPSIGDDPDDTNPVKGYMDEFAFWSKSLSHEEIVALYNYTKTKFQPAFQNETLSDGTYEWNVLAYDNESNSAWGDDNFTFTVDTLKPNITFVYPTPDDLDGITTAENAVINVTTQDANQHMTILDWNRSLIAWWTFDNTSGTTVYDRSTYKRNGTMDSDADIEAGYFGQGMYTGDSGSFDVPDHELWSGMTELSVVMWVNFRQVPSEEGTRAYLLRKRNSTGPEWDSIRIALDDPADTPYFIVRNSSRSSATASSPTAFVSDVWYQIVGVYNGTHAQIYVDGVPMDAGPPAMTGPVLDTDSGMYFSFGSSGVANATTDEIQIYNRALTPEEINASYNALAYQYQNTFSGLTEGTYTYKAYTVDRGGNRNETVLRTLTVDDTDPTVALSVPDDWSGTTNHDINFTSTITDNLNVANATLYTNDTGTWTAKETRWNGEIPYNDSDLVFLFHFNNESQFGENETYALDFAGKDNNATCITCPTLDKTGKYGNSYDFGANDAVFVAADSPDLDLTDTITVSAWVYPQSSPTTWTAIMMRQIAAGNYETFWLGTQPDGNWVWMVYTGAGYSDYVTWTEAPLINEWQHIVGTYNGSDVKFYLNGALLKTVSHSGTMSAQTNPVHIGAELNGATILLEWPGLIDEAAMWNRTLNSTEVAALYNHTKTQFEPVFQNRTLSEGKYIWNVYGMDTAGNSNWGVNYTFTVDNTDPTVTLQTPADWSGTTNHDTNFTSTITDALNAVNATLYTNDTGTWTSKETRWNGEVAYNSSGLYALYHFNNESSYGENESTFLDWSGNGRNITCTTLCPTFNASGGKFGGAYDWEEDRGVMGHVNADFDFLDKNFTYAFWFWKANMTSRSFLLSKGGSYSIYIENGGILLGQGAGPWDKAVTSSWIMNNSHQWYHVVIALNTSDGNRTYFYVDGDLVAEDTTFSGLLPDNTDTQFAHRAGSGIHNGSYDEIAVFNYTLTAAEVSNLYNYTKTNFQPVFQNRTLSEGKYIWNVLGSDTAGNTDWASNYTFTVDNTDPTVTLQTPADLSGTTNHDINFTSTITDALNVGNATLYTNDTGTWTEKETRWNGEVPYNSSELVALWHFNNESEFGENDTHVFDFSGNGNNGMVIGGSATSTDSQFGRAMMFDGNGDWVAIPYQNLSDSLTYSMWFKRNSTEQDLFTFMKTLIRVTDTQIRYWPDHDSGSVSVAWTANSDWNHLVVTQSGNTCNIYLNNDNILSQACLDITSSDNSNFIGNYGGQEWEGLVDEVAIWNRSLSAAEVSNIYNYTKTSFQPLFQNRTLSEGKYIWNVYGMDTAGNGAWASNYTFTVDNTDPTVTLQSPADWSGTTNHDINFTSTITDELYADNATLYTNDTGTWTAKETRWNGEIAYNMTGLYALYHFNNESQFGENSSLFKDWSGNGRNFTCKTLCPRFNETGKFGSTYWWKGDDRGYYESDNDSFYFINKSFTYSFWVMGDGDYGDQTVVDKCASYTIWIDDYEVWIGQGSGGYDRVGTTGDALPLSYTWYHVVIAVNTSDNNMTYIYVNGNLITAEIWEGMIPSNTATYMGFRCGGSDPYHGNLDELAVFNYTLTASEVEAIYNYSKTSFQPVFQNRTLSEGKYIWNVLGSDTAGNTDWGNWNYTFTVDNTDPTVTLSIPANDSTRSNHDVNFTSTITDNLNVANMTLYTNDTGTWTAKETRWNGEIPYNSSGLIALWHFNNESALGENDTWVYDWSRNNNSGAVTLATLTDSKFGKSFEYDGSTTYIKVNSSPSLNMSGVFTVSAWVKNKDTVWVDTNRILSTKYNWFDNTGWEVKLQSAGRVSVLGSSSTSAHIPCVTDWETTDLNKWVNVVVVFNNTQAIGYCNGVNKGSGAIAAVVYNSSNPLYIGSLLTEIGISTFDGPIDEVAIWNRSFNASEIEAMYNYSKTQFQPVFQNRTLADGEYIWNVLGSDTAGNTDWGDSNFTFAISSGECTISADCGAGYQCISNYCFATQGRFVIENSTGDNVTIIDKFGQMAIAGTLSQNCYDNPDGNDFEFLVGADSKGWIDGMTGNMCINGTLTEQHSAFVADGNDFVVVNASNSPMMLVNGTTGDLYTRKRLVQNAEI